MATSLANLAVHLAFFASINGQSLQSSCVSLDNPYHFAILHSILGEEDAALVVELLVFVLEPGQELFVDNSYVAVEVRIVCVEQQELQNLMKQSFVVAVVLALLGYYSSEMEEVLETFASLKLFFLIECFFFLGINTSSGTTLLTKQIFFPPKSLKISFSVENKVSKRKEGMMCVSGIVL